MLVENEAVKKEFLKLNFKAKPGYEKETKT